MARSEDRGLVSLERRGEEIKVLIAVFIEINEIGLKVPSQF